MTFSAGAAGDILLDSLPYKLYRPANARDGDPLPADVWKVEEVEPLNPSFGSPDLAYSDFPKSIESIIAFDNWTGGVSPTRLQSQPDTYWTSQGVDGRRPNQLILGPALVRVPFATPPTGAPVKQVDFAGSAYLIAGNQIYKLDPVTPIWNSVFPGPTGATFTDLAVFNNLLLACASGPNSDAGSGGTVTYGANTLTDSSKAWTANQWAGRVVLAGGQTNTVASNTATVLTFDQNWASTPGNGSAYTIDTHIAYYFTANGSSWSRTMYAGTIQDAPKADFFTTIRANFWKAVKPNKLYATTDPTTLSLWQSTATFVGDQTRDITSVVGYNIDLAVGKEDGLWTIDRSGNDFAVVPELRNVADSKNCQNMRQWRTGLMFRVRNGLYRYTNGKLESIGLDRYRASGAIGSPKVLQVVDIAPYMNECFILLQPSDASSIAIASFMQDPNRWHVFGGVFSAGQGTYLAASASAFAFPTLWLGRLISGTYDTAYVRLPNATDNPLDDVGYQYTASATITLPEQQPLPDQEKEWTKLVLQALAQGTTGTVAVAYAADSAIDSQSFTSMLGPQNQATQSGVYQEWFFPMSGDSQAKSFSARSIQFRITLTNTTPSDTPVIKHGVVHFKHRPQPRRRITASVVCEDGAATRQHMRERRRAEVQFHDLEVSRFATQPVQLQTPYGDMIPVFFEKLSHNLLEVTNAGRPRLLVQCVLLEHLDTFSPALPPRGTR